MSSASTQGKKPPPLPGVPEGLRVVQDREEVLTLVHSAVLDVGHEFVLSAASVVQVFEENLLKVIVVCCKPESCARIDLSHWPADEDTQIVAFVPIDDVSSTLPLGVSTGMFYASGRPWLCYSPLIHKLTIKNWLEAKTGECIVCYDSPTDSNLLDASKTGLMGCNHCVALLCSYCILDLATQQTAHAIDSEVTAFPCPNCRRDFEAHFSLASFKTCLRLWQGAERSLQLSTETKKLVCRNAAKWVQRCKRHITSKNPLVGCLTQSKDGCHQCGKKFWDKAEYKRAPKCGSCRLAVYCSAKCRKKHAKFHKYLCEPKKVKRKKKKKKKAASGS